MEKLKTFVKKNGKKIVIGVGIVTVTGVACYLGCKNTKLINVIGQLNSDIRTIKYDNENLKLKVDELLKDNNILEMSNRQLSYDRDTLMSAASEGLYEEAIATTTRKINWVTDKIMVLSDFISSNPNSNDAKNSLAKYNIKLDILTDRRKRYVNSKELYELLLDD